VTVRELGDSGEVECLTEYRNDLGNGFQIILTTRGHYVDMDLMHIVDGEIHDNGHGIRMPKSAVMALSDVVYAIIGQVDDIDKSRLS